jgi:hypothetical protein
MLSLDNYHTLNSINSCSGCPSYYHCFATSKRLDDQVEKEGMKLHDYINVANYPEGMYPEYTYQLLMSMVGKYLSKNNNPFLYQKIQEIQRIIDLASDKLIANGYKITEYSNSELDESYCVACQKILKIFDPVQMQIKVLREVI